MPFVPALRLTPAQFIGISLAELQRPLADCLVGDDDAKTDHQLFDVAKVQRKPKVEPHYAADDLGRKAEAALNLGIFHPATLQNFAGCRGLTVPCIRFPQNYL